MVPELPEHSRPASSHAARAGGGSYPGGVGDTQKPVRVTGSPGRELGVHLPISQWGGMAASVNSERICEMSVGRDSSSWRARPPAPPSLSPPSPPPPPPLASPLPSWSSPKPYLRSTATQCATSLACARTSELTRACASGPPDSSDAMPRVLAEEAASASYGANRTWISGSRSSSLGVHGWGWG